MYVIDITRDYGSTDMLCGIDSMDAKSKTINYIMDYALANYNLSLDREVLDQNLNIDKFSLNNFLKENYSITIDNDLLIQSIPTDKKHCLFLKYMDSKSDFPTIYSFHKREINKAKSLLKFLVNDALIDIYQDNLSEYEKLKIKDNAGIIDTVYPKLNIACKIVSLYNDGRFLEELLNNTCSLKQLEYEKISKGIDI